MLGAFKKEGGKAAKYVGDKPLNLFPLSKETDRWETLHLDESAQCVS